MNRNSIAPKAVAATLLLASCVAPTTVHAGYVYWYESADSGGNDAIMRKDLEGAGSAEVVYSTTSNLSQLEVDENFIYFQSGSKIKRVNIDGTGLTTLVTNDTTVRGIAVDGSDILFLERTKFKKWDGSSITTLATGLSQVQSIGINSTAAFLGASMAQSSPRQITILNKTTGSSIGSFSIGSPHTNWDNIAATDTYVYVLASSEFSRYDLDGSNKTALDTSSEMRAVTYAEEGGNSYLFYGVGDGKIKLIKNGGSPTVFHTASGTGSPTIWSLGTYDGGSGAPEPAETFAFLGLLTACCLGFRQWRQGRVSAKATERS